MEMFLTIKLCTYANKHRGQSSFSLSASIESVLPQLVFITYQILKFLVFYPRQLCVCVLKWFRIQPTVTFSYLWVCVCVCVKVVSGSSYRYFFLLCVCVCACVCVCVCALGLIVPVCVGILLVLSIFMVWNLLVITFY